VPSRNGPGARHREVGVEAPVGRIHDALAFASQII
jgi:hypothetical protein